MKFLLSLFCIFTLSSTAFAADFHKVFVETILPHEGGYTSNKSDPGNWTGGKVGKGKLMGTKYGIAANTYGASLLKQGRTIKGLTVADAELIYKKDYWDAYHLGELKSQGIADEFADEIINGGPGLGQDLLAKVLKEIEWSDTEKLFFKVNPPPARFTRETIAWINNYTKARDNRISFYNSLRIKRVGFYVKLVEKRPKMRQFFQSWIFRTVD